MPGRLTPPAAEREGSAVVTTLAGVGPERIDAKCAPEETAGKDTVKNQAKRHQKYKAFHQTDMRLHKYENGQTDTEHKPNDTLNITKILLNHIATYIAV